jgi:hypothetical protein
MQQPKQAAEKRLRRSEISLETTSIYRSQWSFSLLRYRNYKDFAPPELVIDSTTSTAESHVTFFNYLLKMPALVLAR